MPRIHTIDVQRLTPLGQLLAEYMRQQWPRLQTKAELAHHVGVRPSTIDNLMYSQHEPSTRTLNKIAHATGIPATRLYEAAAGFYTPPPPVEAIHPPQPRRRAPQARGLFAEQAPNTLLADAIARIRATYHPAMAEAMIQGLVARAEGRNPDEYWQTRISEAPPWDDHDAVTTMELSTILPTRTANTNEPQVHSQADSQPAGRQTSSIR